MDGRRQLPRRLMAFLPCALLSLVKAFGMCMPCVASCGVATTYCERKAWQAGMPAHCLPVRRSLGMCLCDTPFSSGSALPFLGLGGDLPSLGGWGMGTVGPCQAWRIWTDLRTLPSWPQAQQQQPPTPAPPNGIKAVFHVLHFLYPSACFLPPITFLGPCCPSCLGPCDLNLPNLVICLQTLFVE